MLSKVTFPHTSLLSGRYNLAYDCMQKHTRGIFSWVGIFLTVTPALELTQEFLITYILTFACAILFMIPFKIHFVHILRNLCQLYIFTSIFVQPLHIGHIIIGLYQAACETGQFQVPMPKAQDNKPKKD